MKRLILPELSAATGRDITAQKIYINIFPLFIEARDLKVFDSGNLIVVIPRVKGYIGVTAFLRKEINIRRLVINSPELKSEQKVVEDIIGKVKKYLSIKRELPFKVKIRSINISNGSIELTEGDSVVKLNGVSSDVLISPAIIDTRINLLVHNAELSLKNWPSLRGSVRSSFFVKKDSIDLKTFNLMINGSGIDASGLLPFKLTNGEIKARFNILMETLKKFFGLKNRGEGEISAEGSLRFSRGMEFRSDFLKCLLIDLDLKGSIYIQSLLELVRVKEKIEGHVDFSGNLKGPLNRLSGKGRAIMRDGNLFGISVKTLRCNVDYREGMLYFSDGMASLYNGNAQAIASVQLYGGDFYSVDVKADEIDSGPLLDLIGWRPDILPGKVRGEFRTYSTDFKPSGWFEYRAISKLGNSDYILRRIKSIKGFYTMENNVLTLHDARAKTGPSELVVNGNIDISSSTLDLKTELLSQNITDISSPYLINLSGSGRFSGTVKGKFSDPIISGHIDAETISLYSHRFGLVRTDIDYRKNELTIRDLMSREAGAEIKIKGSIGFPGAKEIFDLKNPFYNLTVTARKVDLLEIGNIMRREKHGNLWKIPITGILDSDLSIKGITPEIKGSITIHKPSMKDVMFDALSASFIYEDGELRSQDIMIKKSSEGKDSIIRAKGIIHRDETVQFRINGEVSINDIYKKKDFPILGILNFEAYGKGRLKNPDIDITANLIKGSVKRANIGDSRIKAFLRDKRLSFESFIFNDKAIIKGNLDLIDLSWNARMELRSGRYDSLITAFLKDVPEDLLVNIKGHVDLIGKREHFEAKGLIDEMNITLYGHSFSCERDISFSMKDWKITIPPLRMRSGATSFNIQGVVDINREIDISMEGRSSLSPLKGFSKKIETIRGESEFVLSISGKWDSPRINGGLTISNAFLGIKGIPHRLSNAKGYLYIDEDRIVIDKISGKIGGGDIDMSGITYLKGFKMKKFYIDSIVNDITLNLSKDFPVNFNGNLLLRGTPESRILSGEIRINRARYKERVEWKSWLLKAKPKERPKGEIGAIEDTELNIKIYGTDNITIDNNIARAQVKLDMLLRGTLFQPVIFGRVESVSGNVYFRNNEFRIVKASADFSDPKRINPVMEIVATASIKGYNIRLNLQGQMEHFNLQLLSDPPLPEIDILSLLTVGKFGKELKGIESGIGAGEATSFLTGKMQDIIEERVRSLTGLDRLEVDPYVSKTTGTISPRITVSKRLLGDRLFVTYSSAVGTAENNVLKLEYILNKNVSLVGVRDEKGGIGGDIKFRFEFK
ncbi:MAG: translocation/assembly module TamB domain-containing protein [Thermodesulfovibrionales bacterium]